MSFASDLSKYANKAKLSVDAAVVSICVQASNEIINRTPIDKGTARGNWFAEINGTSKDIDLDRREGEAKADAEQKAQKAAGNIFTLTNNLPYIRRLEYGWSKQNPSGMVRVVVAEIQNKLKGKR